MKTLNWKRTNWNARNFIFSIGQEITGQLTFSSIWKFNAVYTDQDTELAFAQKSFWDSDVLITKDGKTVGEMRSGLFGKQTLKLATGETFILSTSLWEQEVYWKTAKGETMIHYQQAAMSSMEKGMIRSEDSLTSETEKILISSGLFIRQLTRKRRALTVAVFILIFAAASRQ